MTALLAHHHSSALYTLYPLIYFLFKNLCLCFWRCSAIKLPGDKEYQRFTIFLVKTCLLISGMSGWPLALRLWHQFLDTTVGSSSFLAFTLPIFMRIVVAPWDRIMESCSMETGPSSHLPIAIQHAPTTHSSKLRNKDPIYLISPHRASHQHPRITRQYCEQLWSPYIMNDIVTLGSM